MYKFWSDKNKEKYGKNTKSVLHSLFQKMQKKHLTLKIINQRDLYQVKKAKHFQVDEG